jgi:predicted DNA-binding transcriptional regulator YafY
VQERFLLDAPGWFQSDDDVPHLAALAEALWDERRVAARYARADKVVTRTLDPLGLVCKAGVWYLVARHRADIRTYRVSRLQKVTVTERRFERPDAFVLDVHWAESSRDFEASILHLDVRVRISAAGLRALRRQVEPASATAALEGAGEPDEDGWVETTIPVEGLPHGHQVMLRLGTAVEVLEPTELREMLGNTARTLAGRYT